MVTGYQASCSGNLQKDRCVILPDTGLRRRVEGLGFRVYFVVLYCNFTSLAFLGLLGFLRRQLKTYFLATLLSSAKFRV